MLVVLLACIVPPDQLKAEDTLLPNELRPCRIALSEDGQFSIELTQEPANRWVYDRGEPRENERALRQALPA